MFPKRLRQMSAYTAVRRLHLWLAVTVGGVFVVAGLSGSVIVFDHAIDEFLNPELLLLDAPVSEAERLPYQTLYARATAYAEAHDYQVVSFAAPRHVYSSQLFWIKPLNATGFETYELYLHPATGAVIGQRQWGEYLTSFLYMFHHTLWLGKTGKLILGYSAIGMVVLLVTGIYVWWPRGRGWHQWKAALTIKPHAGVLRRLFDLHRVAGIYGLLVLLVVVSTGIYIVFTEVIRSWVPGTTSIVKMLPIDPKPETRLNIQDALDIARRELPESRFSRLYTGDGKQAWLMTFATEGDPRVEHGYNRMAIQPETGEVLEKRRWSEASTADRFFGWFFSLHNGEAFGIIGRVLVCIAGVLPTLLMVTGIWRWLRKKKRG